MNIRKVQIDDFLSKRLPEYVRNILEPTADNTEEIRKRIDELKELAAQFKADVEQNEEYIALKELSLTSSNISVLENDVYSYLYNFFNRYYDEGDFISKRRYKEGVYSIPYEGEEVKLYWANHDQYYIKTAENFKDYSFISNNITIHFMLVDATTEQNNNKENGKKRAFMLFTENTQQPDIKTFELKENKFIIRFIYDISEENQKSWNDKNYNAIKEYIIRSEDKLIPLITPSITFNKETISPIQKHLLSYIAKNTFDYFIHKDLSGFLKHELDFFIKNEFIHIDVIDTFDLRYISKYIAKIKAIKKVGLLIIDFLAQIENFQKKLWLKKKFIIRTDWCISLDRIPEDFYEEIAKNKAQVQEWIDLYAIDETVGDLGFAAKWSNPPSVEFLKANKNLLIDTKHFSPMFKESLISFIDNLDELTNGVLIHSENFQALQLLQSKYTEQIECVYIDPPYNTASSEILYKNGYKHSSWNSLIYDRIQVCRPLLSKKAFNAITIDYEEVFDLGKIGDSIYGADARVGIVTIFINPKGRQHERYFASSTEYMLVYANQLGEGDFNKTTVNEDKAAQFVYEDEIGKYRLDDFARIRTSTSKEVKPEGYYPIYVSRDFNKITLEKTEGYHEVFPIGNDGNGYSWKVIHSSFESDYNRLGLIVPVKENEKIVIKNKYYEQQVFHNIWKDDKYFSEFNGTNLLKKIFGNKNSTFSYPKSIFAVEDALKIMSPDYGFILDYFAGSATTGHAIVNLNRQDDGNRKYILVEMGEYFNAVTKPRMKKIIYAKDWKDGKPVCRDTGVPHLMKYFQLESYEDTLTNIEFENKNKSKALAFGDEYLIHYMLNTETKGSLLNIDKFKNPFDYRLKITEKNEVKETPVDLPETFNYLIGLNVIRQDSIKYFNAVKNGNKDYEGSVDLISDISGVYYFKQIEGFTNDNRKVLIIWRNITSNLIENNAALDAYFLKSRTNAAIRDYDIIYVNGDNNLQNIRHSGETWKVVMTEEEFFNKMFEE